MRKLIPLALAVLSSLLLWAAWPTSPLTFLIFIAFIPLLVIADRVKNPLSYFGCIFLTTVLWNVLTTWWVGNTPIPVSGVLANVANALLMAFPWMGYKSVREKLGKNVGYFALVSFWLLFEHIHLRWELSWPWLTIGNVFATHPDWVQWYDVTGANGGTLWVLLMNISLYEVWRKRREMKAVPGSFVLWKEGWKPLALLAIPLLISYVKSIRPDVANGNQARVVIVQPNIDPYQKFEADPAEVVQQFLRLSAQKRPNIPSTSSGPKRRCSARRF
ncbi:hypothetical protein MKQ70_33750 [Chitinophaga sedimenti]|uniref:hypothetical protein n=1 Tax=Chitinophaga sedimenti TaxID=2033606 RepID=UPI002005C31C|nr:hypothetical protein [Chitinophaga sedimenti]MCK7559646.1 hypothetical protein [Chitinophaga sedimenti]